MYDAWKGLKNVSLLPVFFRESLGKIKFYEFIHIHIEIILMNFNTWLDSSSGSIYILKSKDDISSVKEARRITNHVKF